MRNVTITAAAMLAAGLTAPANAVPIFATGGEVTATWTGGAAGYYLQFGRRSFGTNRPWLVDNSGNASTGSFGGVDAGTALTFYLYVTNTQEFLYTDAALNMPAYEPAGVTVLGPTSLRLTFDDSYGQTNYTDFNVTLTNVTLDAPLSVPEPAGWALMLTGFGLAGMALRWRDRAMVAA